MDLLQEKAAIRAQMCALRASITPPARKKAQDDLAERLYSLSSVRNAKVVGVYQAVGSELSINDLVKALRLLKPSPIIAYPVVCGDGIMEFIALEPGENHICLQSPSQIVPLEALDRSKIVEPSNLDLLFVPGVAFDEKCFRLGMGGGFYDRFLPKLKGDCLTVGIAFDEQIMEKVPSGVHDRRVDYVATPTRIIQR